MLEGPVAPAEHPCAVLVAAADLLACPQMLVGMEPLEALRLTAAAAAVELLELAEQQKQPEPDLEVRLSE